MDESNRGPDELFAFENILRIILDVKKYDEWLKKEKIDLVNNNLFDGYKFFIETAFRRLINELIDDSSLQFEEDDAFRRADFTGIDINDLPNSCEKTRIVKQLKSILGMITSTRTKDELIKNLNPLIDFLDKIRIIYNNSIVKDKVNVKKEEMLKYISLFWIYIFLIDNRNGLPQGYYITILKNELNLEKMKNAFKGYQYALKFVIEQNYGLLTGKELNKITNSENEFKEEDLVDPFEDEFEKDKKSEEYLNVLKWRSIDRFHSIARKEIIEPIEKENKIQFGMNRFFALKNYNKEVFESYLKSSVQEPEYLDKNDKKSLFKKLDLSFLFYNNFEVLDTQRSQVFNGVPAFIYVTKGFSISKQENDIDEPVKVIRFVHPEEGVGGNNYSYAVLIEAYGSLADYSGWLIFYDCCGDYSGFSGSEHANAESFIKEYSEEGLLEVQEFKIDLKPFREYLAKGVTFRKNQFSFENEIASLERSSEEMHNQTEISKSKELLMELITYYLQSKKEPIPDKIEWHVIYKPDIEFDVIFKKGDKITFCECKWSKLNEKNNLNSKIQKIINKKEFEDDWGKIEEKNIEKIYFSFKEDKTERARKEKQEYTVISVKRDFDKVYPEFKQKIKKFKFFSKDLDK